MMAHVLLVLKSFCAMVIMTVLMALMRVCGGTALVQKTMDPMKFAK
jgi:hypothetical protein